MSGIFDAGLELNEKESFWTNKLPTALPRQLKKLGYHAAYWYGGNVTYGNFNQFAPSCGFDEVETATDFCGPDAPKTWVGVYDNLFLEKAADMILSGDEERGNISSISFIRQVITGPSRFLLKNMAMIRSVSCRMLGRHQKQQEFAKESRDLLVLRPGDWKVPAHHEGSLSRQSFHRDRRPFL